MVGLQTSAWRSSQWEHRGKLSLFPRNNSPLYSTHVQLFDTFKSCKWTYSLFIKMTHQIQCPLFLSLVILNIRYIHGYIPERTVAERFEPWAHSQCVTKWHFIITPQNNCESFCLLLKSNRWQCISCIQYWYHLSINWMSFCSPLFCWGCING